MGCENDTVLHSTGTRAVQSKSKYQAWDKSVDSRPGAIPTILDVSGTCRPNDRVKVVSSYIEPGKIHENEAGTEFLNSGSEIGCSGRYVRARFLLKKPPNLVAVAKIVATIF